MQNRFNRLGSKEWLPFQKSWFRFQHREGLYRSNLRFFCKAEAGDSGTHYIGPDTALWERICKEENIPTASTDQTFQFILIDLLNDITPETTLASYQDVNTRILKELHGLYHRMENRRFVAILAPNIQNGATFYPFAWQLAKQVSEMLSLKDEKIACLEGVEAELHKPFFTPGKELFYCLYFRKDEHSTGNLPVGKYPFFTNNQQMATEQKGLSKIPSWFILKPQPRKKQEILHPAKYPEDLVDMFVNTFTQPGQTVFDPMSGTGSTQLGAIRLGRNAFGTELSAFFAGIATDRCRAFCALQADEDIKWKITQKDARLVMQEDTPPIDYLLTSPPYWDMLNMKGAENQAKRLEKGLQTNYSDIAEDLGNLADYRAFVDELVSIYFNLVDLMQPGSYATIVVKNIKKKGSNYPFAWDLALALQQRLILLPEVFWCQDDLSIAPYGYGNTWVSNTFHQYCLNFQKPL